MPITYQIDSDARLVRTVATGLIVDADLRGHEDRLASDPEFVSEMDQIVDGRTIQQLDVSADAVRGFVSYETGRHAQRFAGHRVAIVAPEDVVFGMARMYQTMSRVDVGVFRSVREAMQFLGRPGAES